MEIREMALKFIQDMQEEAKKGKHPKDFYDMSEDVSHWMEADPAIDALPLSSQNEIYFGIMDAIVLKPAEYELSPVRPVSSAFQSKKLDELVMPEK